MIVRGAIIGGLLMSAAIGAASGLKLFKVNPTESLPRGVYVRSFEAIAKGRIVFFPMPESLKRAASDEMRAYFSRPGNGLLKPVVATAGDEICLRDDAFTVNGKPLWTISPVTPPPSWGNCRTLTADQIAAFSDRIPDSLDSRIYGPVEASSAKVYRPLLTE